jgi:hypothetical protein
MLEKINNNQIPDILKDSSVSQTNTPKPAENDDADALLQISYDSLIEKTKQIPTEDENAVQQAKKLLLSGELENPENIEEAAENIANYGI